MRLQLCDYFDQLLYGRKKKRFLTIREIALSFVSPFPDQQPSDRHDFQRPPRPRVIVDLRKKTQSSNNAAVNAIVFLAERVRDRG
jgi:hypothetical protein